MKKYKGYKKTSALNREYNGITFDSKTEVNFYKYLEEQKIPFIYQPKPAFEYTNFTCPLTERNVKHSYTPDFIYSKGNDVFIIDTKGRALPSVGFLAGGLMKRDGVLEKGNDRVVLLKYLRCIAANLLPNNIEKVFFQEITEDLDGNGIELEKYAKRISAYKKSRKLIVKILIEKFHELCKEQVRNWNKFGKININFLKKIDVQLSSKEWKSYKFIKNNKLYRSKQQIVDDILSLYRKCWNAKTLTTREKYAKLGFEAVMKHSGLKIKKAKEKRGENENNITF